MRTITIPWPDPQTVPGVSCHVPVIVSWFPGLTKDQTLANMLADMDGYPRPYEDPNMIDVVLVR